MDQIGLILDTVYLSDNEWNKVTQILPHSLLQRHSRVPEKPLTERFTNIDIDGEDLFCNVLCFCLGLEVISFTVWQVIFSLYHEFFSTVNSRPNDLFTVLNTCTGKKKKQKEYIHEIQGKQRKLSVI
jgi:hypothetical protein